MENVNTSSPREAPSKDGRVVMFKNCEPSFLEVKTWRIMMWLQYLTGKPTLAFLFWVV
ncbi:hypothetical protein ACQKMN_00305 [Ureibacillus composti]